MSEPAGQADPAHWRDDPPPYPWQDDPAQPFGPVPPGLAVGMGVPVALIGAWLGLAGGLRGTSGERVAAVVVGVVLVAVGAEAVWMGLRRRAWRQRHPGADPLAVARSLEANAGSAFGNDSWAARLGRWLLVVVSGAVLLVCVLALQVAFTRPGGTNALQVIVVVALGVLSAWACWQGIARSAELRRQRRGR